MTDQEIATVVTLLAIAHGKTVDEDGTLFDVYEPALADLELPDPRAAVKRILRTVEKWPSPATLRRFLLASYGCLAPDEDLAWSMAVVYATGRTVGRAQLHPAVTDAVDAMGGTWSIRQGTETTVRAQFRDMYRAARARHDQEAMERTWTGVALCPGGRDDDRRALPG